MQNIANKILEDNSEINEVKQMAAELRWFELISQSNLENLKEWYEKESEKL